MECFILQKPWLFFFLSIPTPLVLTDTLYPKSGTASVLSDSARGVQVLVQYLDPSTNITDINVTMQTQSSKNIVLDVVSLTLTNSFCLEILCAVHSLDFLLPATGNPDGQEATTVVALSVFACIYLSSWFCCGCQNVNIWL